MNQRTTQLERELRSIPLLAALDEAQLDMVMTSMRTRHLDNGERLFAKADAAHHFYFLRLSGARL